MKRRMFGKCEGLVINNQRDIILSELTLTDVLYLLTLK